jgi:hypothetical protein
MQKESRGGADFLRRQCFRQGEFAAQYYHGFDDSNGAREAREQTDPH